MSGAYRIVQTNRAADSLERPVEAAHVLVRRNGQIVEHVAVGHERRIEAHVLAAAHGRPILEEVRNGSALRQLRHLRMARLAQVRIALRKRVQQRIGRLVQIT